MTNATFSYQWVRKDVVLENDIPGATGSTYTLTTEDLGKTILVRASFIDDAGNPESLTSQATAAVAAGPNTPATGEPTVSGMAWVGETLTAGISGIADEDGLDNATYSYQWLATDGTSDSDIEGATEATYTLTDSDVSKTIKVRVSFSDDLGNPETLTSAVTDAVLAPGQSTAGPAPNMLRALANGDGSVTLTWVAPEDDSVTGYQLLRRHPGESEGSIVETVVNTESTATAYTDDGLQEGILHAWTVRAFNAAGLSERSNYDNATPHRLTQPDTGAGPPTVYLTFDDGPKQPYTDQILDVLETYGARATFFVTGRNAALHSDAIARMAAERHGVGNHAWSHERLTHLTHEQFNGTVMRTQDQIGAHASQCLRPPYGSTNSSVYEWAHLLGLGIVMWHVDSGDYKGPGVDAIVSHLSSHVSDGKVVLLHDGGQTVEALGILLGQWSRHGYQFKPVCEPPNIPVAPPNQLAEGAPTISGSLQVGNALTADVSGIRDGDGMTGASFSYQWLADNMEIAGAASSSYLVSAEDKGKTIMVRVSVTDDAGFRESLTSVPSAPVAEAEPPPGTGLPPQLQAVGPTGNEGELAVSWVAPASTEVSEPTGYRVEWKPSARILGRRVRCLASADYTDSTYDYRPERRLTVRRACAGAVPGRRRRKQRREIRGSNRGRTTDGLVSERTGESRRRQRIHIRHCLQ